MDQKKFRDRLRYIAKKIDQDENPSDTDSAKAWDRQKFAAYRIVHAELTAKNLTVPELPMFADLKREIENVKVDKNNKVYPKQKAAQVLHKKTRDIPWRVVVLVAINLITSLVIVEYTSRLYSLLSFPTLVAGLFEAFILIFSYEEPRRWSDIWWLRIAAALVTMTMMLKPTVDQALTEYSTVQISTTASPQTALESTLKDQVKALVASTEYHRKQADKYPSVYVTQRADYIRENLSPLEKQLASKRDELETVQKSLISEAPTKTIPIETIRNGFGQAYPMLFLFIFNIWTARLAGRRFRNVPRGTFSSQVKTSG